MAGLRPKTSNFIKKETLAQVFSVNFVKFLRTLIYIEYLWWLLLTLILQPHWNLRIGLKCHEQISFLEKSIDFLDKVGASADKEKSLSAFNVGLVIAVSETVCSGLILPNSIFSTFLAHSIPNICIFYVRKNVPTV